MHWWPINVKLSYLVTETHNWNNFENVHKAFVSSINTVEKKQKQYIHVALNTVWMMNNRYLHACSSIQ